MRFYNEAREYYCGIDLHSTTMYACVVDKEGKTVLHRNIAAKPGPFLDLIAPYRKELVVGVECMFCWYWLADVCAEEKIEFVLGHALYMKAVHGGKAKNDKIDSQKIASLLRGGMFPVAYVYPREMRATRDLMRRRLFYVHKRAELLTHVQMTYHQYNFAPPVTDLVYKKNRDELTIPFKDKSVVRMVETDLRMIEEYSTIIRELNAHIEMVTKKKTQYGFLLNLLQTIPGIGPILSTTILYEIHDISRFPTVQQFSSYARVVKPKKTSAGKVTGSGGAKIGNHHLKWAFSEATMLWLRGSEIAKGYMEKLLKKHPKRKAMSILEHKLAIAVYFILQRQKPWSEEKFLNV